MPLLPLPPEFMEAKEERIHPVLTLLLILAASSLGWALLFVVLFLRTL